ncbi:MAG: response regulator transcription factor [Clostridia bacterium]|nr:response regulator transcription factor [Clostridia bacterium]
MPLVYIVDDEPNIRRLAAIALQEAGFETADYGDGRTFLAAVRTRLPDAVVLDWMMPPPDGLELCRMLRESPRTRPIPILMLTARGSEIDRVIGLEMGADDYISKPFGVKELAARVRASLRRKEYLSAAPPVVLRAGGISLDPERHLVLRDGTPVELTPREFDLLHTLMSRPGHVHTRESLMENVWKTEYYGDTRTVDVHMRYLRQKLEDKPEEPRYLQTVRGVGYRFADPGDAQ